MGFDSQDWRFASGSSGGLAMRKRRRSGEGESLAFLDIVTCGFGAIILLLIITKPVPDHTDFTEQQDLSGAISAAGQQVTALQAKLQSLLTELATIPDPAQDSVDHGLNRSLSEARVAVEELNSSNEALELVKETLIAATITQTTTPQQRDPEGGGIPVDSEYVIFVIDTSGSMLEIWNSVIDTIYRIIDIHPKVKGFQVINDDGNYLFRSTKGRWIPDTSKSRTRVKDALRHWQSFSDSNPVQGLESALRTYGRKNEKLSIYVLGDEFTGSSYDEVIDSLNRLNIDPITNRHRARVHSIGFLTESLGSERYSVLMRSVVERNNGAFLGLPR